jgi:hypothetical protein
MQGEVVLIQGAELEMRNEESSVEFGVSLAQLQLERADTVGSGDDSWGDFEAYRSNKSDSSSTMK